MKKRRKLNNLILREYDIRGIVDVTLDRADAFAIGQAFGTTIRRNKGKTVCVAYDGRLSSPEMEDALVRGLVSTGLAVIRVGMGPTPMLYFAANILNADGGIMITGSHNPVNYNGFKMVMNNRPFFGEDIQELGRICADGDYVYGEGFVTWCSITEEYIGRVAQGYDGRRPLKIAWDAGNGIAGPFIRGITRQIEGEHIMINSDVDGTFPNHHPDPTEPENLLQLQDVVLKEKCDLGIAFDGDVDRLGVIDNKGNIMWGDQLMVVFSRDLLANHPKAKIIADVKSSDVLFEQIEKMGGDAIMWKTGHSLIKEKMKESGALLAGEMSGHIFFSDRYYGFDDALYAAMRLIGIFSREEQTVDEIRSRIPKMVNTPELRFPCDDTRKFQVVEEVKQRLISEGADINDIDGVRVSTSRGWWLLRASNTQDVLVARCEARNKRDLEYLKAELNAELQLSNVLCPRSLAA